MEFFVAIALFFIFFSLASGFLALGMALGYIIIVTTVAPGWLLVLVGVGVIWHLGSEESHRS